MTGAVARLTDDQGLGTDPTRNAWLSASAGTGKTQVLTARVLRLLLSGARPSAILAITFTKAGASEMARRIREKLASWVRLSDAKLRKQLWAIHVDDYDDPAVLWRARTLFADVIDAPAGGLVIQTIHSFCQTLLASFPEEAGLAPGFTPLDERELAMLRGEVLGELIQGALDGGVLGFVDRIEQLSLALGEAGARGYLDRCCGALGALDAMPASVAPWLRQQFDLPQSDPSDWLIRQCADDRIDAVALRAIAAANAAWGTKTGSARAEAISLWLASNAATRAGDILSLLSALCTAKGQLLADYGNKPALAEVAADAARLAEALHALPRTAAAMAASDRMAGALEAGRSFARAFAERKRQEGLVDFDDLIDRTVELLATPGRAEWIRYKLDARIDHILVDEAQDTNARQWAIIRSLAEEYFAGEGAREDVVRTLFVVGDYKQAIYGFQGTSPQFFAAAQHIFSGLGAAADHPVADLDIATNFRSSPPILALVDGVIAAVGPDRLGLLSSDAVHHSAHAAEAGGRVTLWPLEPNDGAGGSDDADIDAGEEGWIDSATRRIADRIAASVRSWIDDGIDGEAVRASDVMVLVRKRTDLAGLVVSRLQAHGVPVAGVDRLRLHTPIAVQDLLAAARFALQPLDDLTLACLLVSPLLGWSHDELDRFGRRPRHMALWLHLQSQPELIDRLAPLRDLLNLAGYATPYRFFETLLSGPMQARARLLARLGNAALDPIEELVSQALQFETRVGASLHGFLRWFDAGNLDIKREMDSSADEVRVMTVHGAKGLQARIVILADAAVDPAQRRSSSPVWATNDGELPLPSVTKDERPDALAAIEVQRDALEMEEHWRLLYVALTRAERMLFVAGTLGANKSEAPPDSWYAAIAPVAERLGALPQPARGPWGETRIWAVKGREPARSQSTTPLMSVDIPDWARRPAPDEPRPLRPLAPSAIGEAQALEVPQPPPSERAMRAAERGRLMHALFERLPAVAPNARRVSGERWLGRAGTAFDAAERAKMLDAVLAVIEDPAHAALFGPGSLAEVPFSALVDGRVIAGTVDRLIVTQERVLIADFKTGSMIPEHPDAIAPGYLAQMAAYVAALEVVFDGRRVEAGLVYTAGPCLMMIPPAVIDAHKPHLEGAKANSQPGA